MGTPRWLVPCRALSERATASELANASGGSLLPPEWKEPGDLSAVRPIRLAPWSLSSVATVSSIIARFSPPVKHLPTIRGAINSRRSPYQFRHTWAILLPHSNRTFFLCLPIDLIICDHNLHLSHRGSLQDAALRESVTAINTVDMAARHTEHISYPLIQAPP